MRFVRALFLASALISSAPLFAQELTQSGVKAFIASIDAAISRRDVDTIVSHIAEHAVVSATVLLQGQTQTLRMNKSQYRQMLTMAWSAASSYEYARSNEKISIDGNQATVTADVAESMVIQGQPFATQARERATVENLDGKLMLTQLVVNQVL
jgi:ketosteroid isomerase-like protein